MIKKIVIGTLLVVVTGGLVYGAVNRTQIKTAEAAVGQIDSEYNENQHGRQPETGGMLQNDQVLNEGKDQFWGFDQEVDSGPGNGPGGGNGGSGQGQGQSADQSGSDFGTGEGQAVVDEWVMLEGTVSAIDEYSMFAAIDDGSEVEIGPRAWSYAQDQGFTAEVGDELSMRGFYEGDTYEAAEITNHTTQQTVLLRDENGRPHWAGGGRGGRNGNS